MSRSSRRNLPPAWGTTMACIFVMTTSWPKPPAIATARDDRAVKSSLAGNGLAIAWSGANVASAVGFTAFVGRPGHESGHYFATAGDDTGPGTSAGRNGGRGLDRRLGLRQRRHVGLCDRGLQPRH